jgi:tetratricopeptide (TPR) repeat protein
MEESGRGKLVATLTSPKKTEPPPPPTPEKMVVTPAKTQTNAPAKPVTTQKKTTPPPPSPAPIKEAAKAPTAPKPKASETPTVAPAPPPPKADVRQLLNQGRAALALKALDAASAKYVAVLEMDPTNVVALSSLGAVRYQQNRLDEAEQYLRKAVTAAPNDSTTRSLLGVVFFKKG